MDNVIICEANATEAEEIAQVHTASWKETYKGLLAPSILDGIDVSRRARMWKSIIDEEKDQRVFVAKVDGHVIGFFSIGPGRDRGFESKGEVYAIYLLKAHQGRGIGKALLKKAFDALIQDGYCEAYLAVLDGNPTLGFYKARGGLEVGQKSMTMADHTYVEKLIQWKF